MSTKKTNAISATSVKGATVENFGIPHFYNGNIKVGNMISWGKLAGNVEINGCMGSCGNHCSGCWKGEDWKKSPCYVARSYVQYKDELINSHIVNTLAMRFQMKQTFAILDAALKRKTVDKCVRIHSSGEVENGAELDGWINLARKNPRFKFYIYTKNIEAVDEVMTRLHNNKKGLPDNFSLLISVWHDSCVETYKKWQHCKNIKAFVYCDGYDYSQHDLKIQVMCPAYTKNEKGKVKLSHELTCDKCMLCVHSKAKVIGCLEH